MSGPHGEGLHLPPHGYRIRGLVTAPAIPREPVHTGWCAALERWEHGRFDVAVRPDPDGRTVDYGTGHAGWADQPEAAARLLRQLGWELAVPWEPWCGQALRAPVRRVG